MKLNDAKEQGKIPALIYNPRWYTDRFRHADYPITFLLRVIYQA